MASLTPAAVQNENLHIHRGKGVDVAKLGGVQNENMHIHRGKGLEGFKAEVPKPVKTGRQERKALRDLSQAGKPVLSAVKGKTAVTAVKDKSATTALKEKSVATTLKDSSAARSRETANEASKTSILTDEEIVKCREWAKEGIERMHFSGNDMQKFEAHQQEERVKKKVDKAMAGLRAWTDAAWSDMTFGLEIPVKEVPSDTEDVLKLEFEPEVLPLSPKTDSLPKSGYEEFEDLFDLDFAPLYFDQRFEMKLKDEYETEAACF